MLKLRVSAPSGFRFPEVTISHNDHCADLLAVVRRGPGARPTEDEFIEYLLSRRKRSQERPPTEHYAFEHVLSYQRRVTAIKRLGSALNYSMSLSNLGRALRIKKLELTLLEFGEGITSCAVVGLHPLGAYAIGGIAQPVCGRFTHTLSLSVPSPGLFCNGGPWLNIPVYWKPRCAAASTRTSSVGSSVAS